jgi:hypothetical protein
MPEQTETFEETKEATATAEETSTKQEAEEAIQEEEARQPDPKDQSRAAYEMRQIRKQLEDLRKENEGYKRRDEEARKAKLTQEQRLQEERDAAIAERDTLRMENLRNRVAAEFKLPAAMAARLIGTDEESLRADAEELQKLLPKPRVGSPTDPPRGGGAARIYKRSELRADPRLAASPEVKQAALEGRVIDG